MYFVILESPCLLMENGTVFPGLNTISTGMLTKGDSLNYNLSICFQKPNALNVGADIIRLCTIDMENVVVFTEISINRNLFRADDIRPYIGLFHHPVKNHLLDNL